MPVAPAKIHEIQGPPNTEPKSSSTSPTNIEKGERTFKSRVAPAEIQETDCPSKSSHRQLLHLKFWPAVVHVAME